MRGQTAGVTAGAVGGRVLPRKTVVPSAGSGLDVEVVHQPPGADDAQPMPVGEV